MNKTTNSLEEGVTLTDPQQSVTDDDRATDNSSQTDRSSNKPDSAPVSEPAQPTRMAAEPHCNTIPEALDTGLSGISGGIFTSSATIGDNPNLAETDDVDLYEVQLDAGNRLAIDIDADEFGSTLDSVVRLFDSNGVEITFNDDSSAPGENSSFDSYLDFTATTSDTYYIGVSSYGNFNYDPSIEGSGTGSSSGDYDIQILVSNSGESNDTIPEAIETGLSSATAGTYSLSSFIGDNPEVDPGFDTDMFAVQLDEGSVLTVDIDANEFGSSLDSILRIFDETGTEVAFADDLAAPGEVGSFDSYIEFTATETGNYYIGLSDRTNDFYDPFIPGTGDAPGNLGEYDIQVSVSDGSEPNDTIPEAIDTELSSAAPGTYTFSTEIGNNPSVFVADDVDFYAVQINAGDQLTIDIDSNEFGSFLDSVVRLFDSNGVEVAFDDDGVAPGETGSFDSYLDFTATTSDTYYIGVSSFNNFSYDPFIEGSGFGSSAGEYDIEVTLSSGDEPNDTIPEAIDTGLSSAAPGTYSLSSFIGDNPNVTETDDVDFYAVQINAGDQLTIDIDGNEFGSTLDSVVRLFDSNGVEITFSDDSAAPGETDSFDSYLDFTATTSDTYYVGVSSFNNFGYDPFVEGSGFGSSTGEYDIEMTLTDGDEPNDTIPEAIDTGLSSAAPGTYSFSTEIGDNPNVTETNDVDFYAVQVNAGDQLTIDIDGNEFGSSLDSVVRLFDSSGVEITFSDDRPAPGETGSFDSYLDFTATTTDTYYVGVSSFSNFGYDPFIEGSGTGGSTGEYDIEITVEPDISPETGEIAGLKWNDLNGDGVRDANEPGLEGWTIYLDDNQNGQLDANETATTTDADGEYRFTELGAGTYTVAEVLQNGWEQTYPGTSNVSPNSVSAKTDGARSTADEVDVAIERAADLETYSTEELTQATEWVVVFDGDNASKNVNTQFGTRNLGEIELIPNAFRLDFSDTDAATVEEQLASLPGVESFFPLVERQAEETANPLEDPLVPTPNFLPDDPLFADQWHLVNTGQTGGTPGADANVEAAWDEVRGTGVVIGVVDDGLEHAHPDLNAQYRADLSFDFNDNDLDPTPSLFSDNHGTAVGGVAAGRGNNGIGVSGSAPEAELAGLRLIAGPISDLDVANALSHENQEIDIYNNSWSIRSPLAALEPLSLAALQNGTTNGRGGLGNIYVWAAGNGLENNENTNYFGYANSRYTIAVSAIDHNGEQSFYSEPGAPILVAGYSNGAPGAGITTTTTGGRYIDDFGGTSSAAPLVSGVIGLMLEANPNLTWRDVQHILVETAEQNDSTDTDWTTNGAGHLVNHKYGFGAIDAEAVVNAAQTWVNVAPEVSTTSDIINVDTAIPDGDLAGVSSTVSITQDIDIESVEVVFDADHTFRGDLAISLISPDGTESILAEVRGDDKNDYSRWVFSSTRHWGESSLGDWTLRVSDGVSVDTGTWNSWQLNIYGTPDDGDTPNVPASHTIVLDAGEVVEDVNFGNREIDPLSPNANTDLLTGNNDREILGSDGDDTLFAFEGDSILSGGNGADEFWIANGVVPFAPNTIADFEPGIDTIGIDGLGISFDDLTISASGEDAIVSALGSDLAVVSGLAPEELNRNDFVFG
ncbi:MAG: pre-peptidase C-terminal domain-containing protein [Cyanobacteriota bacterium]|nr:pre-peptidase C-terminal domain-containing protein [Cyanobacteriota bacterium]